MDEKNQNRTNDSRSDAGAAHREQETKKSTNVTGPAETSEPGSTYGSDGNDLDVGGIEKGLESDTNRSQGGAGGDQARDVGTIGTQDLLKNIGGRSAGGPAGTGGVSTNDVGGNGPGKSIDVDR